MIMANKVTGTKIGVIAVPDKWVTLKLRHSNIKLLIIETAAGIVRLLSANNTCLRDNIAYIVTLCRFILMKSTLLFDVLGATSFNHLRPLTRHIHWATAKNRIASRWLVSR